MSKRTSTRYTRTGRDIKVAGDIAHVHTHTFTMALELLVGFGTDRRVFFFLAPELFRRVIICVESADETTKTERDVWQFGPGFGVCASWRPKISASI